LPNPTQGILQQHQHIRGNGTHSAPLLAGTNRQAIRSDGETTMTMNMHTQTTAPKSAPATSVSPLEQSGSSKTKFSKARPDICQTVTDSIIGALETGVKPWTCPLVVKIINKH